MTRSIFVRTACALLAMVALATCQVSAAQAATAPKGPKAITADLKTTAQFCSPHSASGKRTLCGLGIHVSHITGYNSFAACLGCGAGRWGTWSKVGQTWEAKGTSTISPRASVLLVVTKPREVGLYRVYRPVEVNTPHARLKLVARGCLGFDIPAASIHASFHDRVRNLPVTTCTAPKHLTASAYTAGTSELSHSTSHALIYGRASKPMWLTVAETSTYNCRVGGPLAYSKAQRRKIWWYRWHVKGAYEEGFRLHARLASGAFCIYMQTGGRYQGEPDGWIAQEYETLYGTGDELTGPASTTLSAAGPTSVTLSGTAPRTETLASYDSLTPCSEFSEIPQFLGFGGSTMQVSGAFTETLITANFSQSGYICSYLDDDGITVAMTTDQVTVDGTQLKVQSDYPETAAQAVTPLSDPVGNVGAAGTAIAAGQTVDVRCILNGKGLVPFDPVWYELASAPWGDAYYAPAYAFYNNGQTYGTVIDGRRWDPKVPACTGL